MGREQEQLLQILFIWSLGESRSKNPRKPSIKDIRTGKKKSKPYSLSLSLTQNMTSVHILLTRKKNSMISPPDYVFYIYNKYLYICKISSSHVCHTLTKIF